MTLSHFRTQAEYEESELAEFFAIEQGSSNLIPCFDSERVRIVCDDAQRNERSGYRLPEPDDGS
jgi:hypothetical protein